MEVDVLTINAQPAIKSVASLKEEIKDLKSQLLNLEQGTEEYNKTLLQLGDAQHELVELNQQMRATTTDFGDQLGNVTRSIAGMSGAVQAVTGTLALMGVEIGDDAKLMKILVAAMSITQGVAAIDSGVKAFKALRISIQAATAAQKGFNLAALKNPYLIAGAAIVAAIVAITKALQKQRKEEEERHKEWVEHLEKELELEKKRAKSRVEQLVEIKKYRQEVAEMTAEQQAAEKKRLENEKKLNDSIVKQMNTSIEKERKRVNELREMMGSPYVSQQTLENLNAEISKREINIKELEDEKVLREELNRQADYKLDILTKTPPAEAKATKTTREALKDEYTLYEKLANAIDLADAKGQEEIVTLQQKIDLEKMHLTELEEGTKAYDRQLVTIAQLEGEMTKMVQAKVAENIEAEKAAKLSAANIADMERQMALIQLQQGMAKSSEGATTDPRRLIQEAAEQQAALAQLQHQITTERLRAEYEAEREAMEAEMELVDTTAERKIELQQQLAELETEYRLNRLTADQELADREVEIEADAFEKRKNLQQSYVNAIASTAQQLGGIFGTISETMEQGTKEWKALKIAEAIINTLAGGITAFMSAMELPYPANLIAAPITMAGVLATGFAQVAKIRATQVSKAASGGATNTMTVQSIANTPTNVRQTSPTWNDEGVIQDTLVNQGDQRVVLVMSDLEAAQGQRVATSNSNAY